MMCCCVFNVANSIPPSPHKSYLVGNVFAAMDAPQLTSAQLGQGRGELREAGILGPNDMFIICYSQKGATTHSVNKLGDSVHNCKKSQ